MLFRSLVQRPVLEDLIADRPLHSPTIDLAGCGINPFEGMSPEAVDMTCHLLPVEFLPMHRLRMNLDHRSGAHAIIHGNPVDPAGFGKPHPDRLSIEHQTGLFSNRR